MTVKNKAEIIKYLEGHSWKETANKFNISEMTINRWLKGNVSVYNKLKSKIEASFNKPLFNMNINELRFVNYLLTNKNQSKTKADYVINIKKRLSL